ncbi:MAG: hypothetical protein AB7I18_14785 [Candidatus Berkiella sp.]
MSKKPLKIAFDDKGNLIDQVTSWMLNPQSNYVLKFEDAQNFKDELVYSKIVDYSRGSARVYFKSAVSGRKYSMFVTDFDDVIKAEAFQNNRITGEFRFVKRGSAQAVVLIIEKAP